MFQFMLVIGEKNDDHIKPHFLTDVIMLDISFGSFRQETLFFSVNHSSRGFQVTSRPCFHFHNDQVLFIFGYNIDLFLAVMPVPVQNLHAPGFKVTGSQLFTLSAQLGFFVCIFHGKMKPS